MSIIPVSILTRGDLLALGNNLVPRTGKPRRTGPGNPLLAVNRSLAAQGERVDGLYAPGLSQGVSPRSNCLR